MKPTQLYPGQRVLIIPSLGPKPPYHGTVVRREPRRPGWKAYAIITIDEFVGLEGSDDQGIVRMSDYEISRQVQPLEAKA